MCAPREGVTIDLNGFEIRRTAGTGGNGIEVDTTADRTTIRNGSLKGFAYGLRCVGTTSLARGGRCQQLSVSGGAGLFAGEGWQIESCSAHDNTATGIQAAAASIFSNCSTTGNSGGTAGPLASTNGTLNNCTATNNTTIFAILVGNGSALTNCSAVGNTGTTGLAASSGCTLTDCSAYNNTVTFGIDVGNGTTLKNCTARLNTSALAVSGGIDAGSGCTLIGCAASGNGNTNATASSSTGLGLRISTGSTARDCTVQGNKGDGIYVSADRCHLIGNTCVDNNTGGEGAGIHLAATSSGCRVDGNHCAGGSTNFLIEGTNNFIVRNTATAPSLGAAYNLADGNHFGDSTTSPGSSFVISAWANTRY